MAFDENGKWCGLGEPHQMKLAAACILVEQALQETCYMVGSATNKRDFRDVDVRVIMNDDKFDTLFGPHTHFKPFQVLFSISVSTWLKEVTGLPVDFQVQRRSDIKESDWDKMRDPLKICDHKELLPEWAKRSGT